MLLRQQFGRIPFGMVAMIIATMITASVGFAGPKKVNDGNQGNPGVHPPQSKPYGLSYAEWSVKWWQWAYSLPVPGHPLFDETGSNCAAGQSGPVWFLGGVFNESGSATRDLCAVPSGKALFFPIIDVEWDNICPLGDLTIDELREAAKGLMDLATDLSCEIDGRSIQNLGAYRVAGDAFGINLPSDNIFDSFGCPTDPGPYFPLVPDGIFLMLSPLSVGNHVIHFRGTLGDPVNFTLEITYHLTVVPRGRFAMADDAEAPDEAAESPEVSKVTWGRVKAIYR